MSHRHALTLAISTGLLLGVVSMFVYRPTVNSPISKDTSLTKVAADASTGLSEPMDIQVQIDTQAPNTNTNISRDLWGVNFAGKDSVVPGDKFSLPDSKQTTLMRFPGGCGSEQYNWENGLMFRKTNNSLGTEQWPTLEKFVDQGNRNNFRVLFTVNMDIYGDWNACNSTYDLEYAASGLATKDLYIAERKKKLLESARKLVSTFGTKIPYYELGNELWAKDEKAAEYMKVASEFMSVMKSTNPDIKIILHSGRSRTHVNTQGPVWISLYNSGIPPGATYAQAHWYDWIRSPSGSGPTTIRSQSENMVGRVGYFPLITLPIRFDATQKNLPLAITEWSLFDWLDPFDRVQNMDSVIYVVESLFQFMNRKIPLAVYHDANTLNGISAYNMAFFLTSPLQDGVLLQSSVPQAPLLDICYECKTSGFLKLPAVTSYSAYSADGALYAFVINHDDQKSARVTFKPSDPSFSIDQVALLSSVDIYGGANPSQITVKKTLTSNELPPASVARFKFAKKAPLTCNIEIANNPFIVKNSLSEYTVNLSGYKQKGQNLPSQPADMRMNTTNPAQVSAHIKSTDAGEWWDHLTPNSVFTPSAVMNDTTSLAISLNPFNKDSPLVLGKVYEVACNVEIESTQSYCSGAVAPGTTTTYTGITYRHCDGQSLVRFVIKDDPSSLPPQTIPIVPNPQSTVVPIPLTSPIPHPQTTTPPSTNPAVLPNPSQPLPPSLTIIHHLYVKMPTEGNSTAPYRDYKKFTIGMIDDAGVQKQYCTKNLDTNEFEYASGQSTGAAVTICKQNPQVVNPHIGERTCTGPYHEFTLQTTLNGNEAVKHWLTHKFAWGMGMDDNETNKKFTDVLASTTKINLTTDKNLSSGQIHTSLCLDQ